jgi:hypothetical protein
MVCIFYLELGNEDCGIRNWSHATEAFRLSPPFFWFQLFQMFYFLVDAAVQINPKNSFFDKLSSYLLYTLKLNTIRYTHSLRLKELKN